jgi:hypothetical protein
MLRHDGGDDDVGKEVSDLAQAHRSDKRLPGQPLLIALGLLATTGVVYAACVFCQGHLAGRPKARLAAGLFAARMTHGERKFRRASKH